MSGALTPAAVAKARYTLNETAYTEVLKALVSSRAASDTATALMLRKLRAELQIPQERHTAMLQALQAHKAAGTLPQLLETQNAPLLPAQHPAIAAVAPMAQVPAAGAAVTHAAPAVVPAAVQVPAGHYQPAAGAAAAAWTGLNGTHQAGLHPQQKPRARSRPASAAGGQRRGRGSGQGKKSPESESDLVLMNSSDLDDVLDGTDVVPSHVPQQQYQQQQQGYQPPTHGTQYPQQQQYAGAQGQQYYASHQHHLQQQYGAQQQPQLQHTHHLQQQQQHQQQQGYSYAQQQQHQHQHPQQHMNYSQQQQHYQQQQQQQQGPQGPGAPSGPAAGTPAPQGQLPALIGVKVQRYWVKEGAWFVGVVTDWRERDNSWCITYDLGTSKESAEWFDIQAAEAIGNPQLSHFARTSERVDVWSKRFAKTRAYQSSSWLNPRQRKGASTGASAGSSAAAAGAGHGGQRKAGGPGPAAKKQRVASLVSA